MKKPFSLKIHFYEKDKKYESNITVIAIWFLATTFKKLQKHAKTLLIPINILQLQC